ncbi:MAG: hypothetical protein Q4A62_07610 [Eikenella sp.]|nr:hypothetical protein [Eikenella sp.]
MAKPLSKEENGGQYIGKGYLKASTPTRGFTGKPPLCRIQESGRSSKP